jgi:competence protein ComEC
MLTRAAAREHRQRWRRGRGGRQANRRPASTKSLDQRPRGQRFARIGSSPASFCWPWLSAEGACSNVCSGCFAHASRASRASTLAARIRPLASRGQRGARHARSRCVDTSIALALALLAGAYLPVAVGPVSVGAFVTWLIVQKRVARVVSAAAAVLMLLAAMRVRARVHAFEDERATVRQALGPPSRCAAHALVVSSPLLMRDRREPSPSGQPSAPSNQSSWVTSWDADLDALDCEGRALSRHVRAHIYGGPADLARGDSAEVVLDLAPVQLFRNVDLPNPLPSAARRGITASGGAQDVRIVTRGHSMGALIDRLRAHVRGRILATFAADAEAMGRALVLGETDLDQNDGKAFRTSGLAHLLAVSGTHLVLVVAGFVAVCTALLRRLTALSARCDVGRGAAVAGIILAWLYADFAGGSGSANRAAAMLSCVLAARALGRG